MQPVLDQTDEHFKNTSIDFKPIAALLLGGIYYANLHSRYNGNIMCGMDVRSEQGQQAILNAIKQIVDWAFESPIKT